MRRWSELTYDEKMAEIEEGKRKARAAADAVGAATLARNLARLECPEVDGIDYL